MVKLKLTARVEFYIYSFSRQIFQKTKSQQGGTWNVYKIEKQIRDCIIECYGNMKNIARNPTFLQVYLILFDELLFNICI